jgi:predicted nuclease with TOPRIM domain
MSENLSPEISGALERAEPQVQVFVRELEAHNAKLEKRLAKLEVENLSYKNRIDALKEENAEYLERFQNVTIPDISTASIEHLAAQLESIRHALSKPTDTHEA